MSWEVLKWVCWAWGERGRLRLGEGGCWAGWVCCLRGQRVLSEVAAAAAAVAAAAVVAVVGLVAEVVAAAVQVDADVAAPRC